MDYNETITLWGSRNRLAYALAPFEMTAFEWLCLKESVNWVKWNAPLGKTISEAIAKEQFWDEGVYFPDASLLAMEQADKTIRRRRFVRKINRVIADAMIFERASYDTKNLRPESLVGFRVLSQRGIRVWNAVRTMEGQFIESRFIRLLSRERCPPHLVFHSVNYFDVELLCPECAKLGKATGQSPLVQVGPWCNNLGELWLSGWRLICPHLFSSNPLYENLEWL